MKKIKAVLSMSLLLVLFFNFGFVNVLAAEEKESEKNYTTLEEIAKDYIVKVTESEDGVSMIKITHIKEFVSAVHKYLPEKKDIAIARFLYEYTGRGDQAYDLPEEILLEILTSEESVVQEEILSPEGNEMRNKLFADDGNMGKFIMMVSIILLVAIVAILAIILRSKRK